MRVSASAHLHRLSGEVTGKRQVSKLSKWEDSVWIFDEEHLDQPRKRRCISWPNDIDPNIVDSMKCLLWSMRVDPPVGNHRYRNLSSVQFFYYLMKLALWMKEPQNDYKSFAEIDEFAAEDYRNDMVARWAGHRANEDGGYKISAKAFSGVLEPIVLSYRQRDKLADAVRVEPFNGLSSFAAAQPVSNSKPGWIPYVPDDIAIPVIRQCVDWIDYKARDIIRLYQDRMSAGRNPRKRAALCGAASFSKLPGASEPWHELKNVGQIGELMTATKSVCAHLILATVGLRISELLSLESDCEEVELSSDGLMEIFYIRGKTYKLEEGGSRDTRWAAGCRPIGSEEIPIPIRAVRVLNDMFRFYRDYSCIKALFMNSKTRFNGLSAKKDFAEVFRPTDRNTFSRYIKLHREWKFSYHQWRKTFARLVIRQDRTALPALSSHFKHLSMAMTDRGYLGSDWRAWDLIDFLQNEQRHSTAEILGKLLSTDEPVAGRMGPYFDNLRERFGGMTTAHGSEELQWIIEDSDLTIHTSDWGFCVYRPETAWCGGGANGPNLANRTPSGCATCANLAIHQEHRPYWNDRRDRNRALLERLSGANELRQEPVRQRLAESEKVLKGLDAVGGGNGRRAQA